MRQLLIVLSFVVAVSSTFFSLSVSAAQFPPSLNSNESITIELKGSVKTTTLYYKLDGFKLVYHFDSNGHLTLDEMIPDQNNGINLIQHTFDNKERPVITAWYQNVSSSPTAILMEYEYDDENHTFQHISTDFGKKNIISKGKLDTLGRIIEETSVILGRKTSTSFNEYDPSGKMLKTITVDVEGKPSSIREMTYMPNGKISKIQYTLVNSDGSDRASSCISYYYENSRLLKVVHEDFIKQTSNTSTYEYLSEDKYHNWTKMRKNETRESGMKTTDIERIIEYF